MRETIQFLLMVIPLQVLNEKYCSLNSMFCVFPSLFASMCYAFFYATLSINDFVATESRVSFWRRGGGDSLHFDRIAEVLHPLSSSLHCASSLL